MGNVISPKLSWIGTNVNVKTYQYGGSTVLMGEAQTNYDYENINDNHPSFFNFPQENHWYNNLDQKTGAFLLSTANSLTFGIVEQLSDGVAMVGGGIISEVARLFGKDKFADQFEKKSKMLFRENGLKRHMIMSLKKIGLDYDIAHGGRYCYRNAGWITFKSHT